MSHLIMFKNRFNSLIDPERPVRLTSGQSDDRERVKISRAFKSGQQSKQRKILKQILFITTYDPFFIYKWNYGKIRTVYNSATLRLQATAQDRSRETLRKALLLYTGYLTAKFSSLVSVEFSIHQLEGSNSNEIIDFLLKKLIIVSRFYKRDGSLSRYFIFIMGTFNVPTLIYSSLLPFYYIRCKPMNAIYWRFILDPLRELNRCDMIIKENLRNILRAIRTRRKEILVENSINIHKSSIASLSASSSQSYPSVMCPDHMEILNKTERQYSLVKQYQTQHWHLLRPSFYSSQWFGKISSYASFLEPSMFIMTTFYAVLCFLIFFYLTVYNRCESTGDEICKTIKAYDRREQLILFESLVEFIIIGVFFQMICLMLLLQFNTQNYMTNSTKELLVTCLKKIRSVNQLKCYNGYHSKHHREDRGELEVDKMILETFVKYAIYELDLKASSGHLSGLMSVVLYGCVHATVVATGTRTMTKTKEADLSLMIFFMDLVCANSLIFVCAFAHKNFLNLQKYLYSIQSELAINTSEHSGDPLSTLWQRLVHSHNSEDQFAVRPFNINMTFRRALGFNFFVLTSISISYARI